MDLRYEEAGLAMDVAMTLPVMEAGFSRDRILEWVSRIDSGPFASLAFGERIAFDNPDVLSLMSACAVLTRRVRLITTVLVLPMYSPVSIAKQCATIDVLSDGRLTLGVGIGGREDDYRAFGADLDKKTNALLGELVGTMRRVWAGEIVGDGVIGPVGPRPVQPGGPPVLAGAMGPKAVRAAAQWADGLCGYSWGPSLEEIGDIFAQARSAWSDAGRERPPRLSVGFWYALGPGAGAQMERHLRHYLDWMEPAEVEAMLPTSGFTGSVGELRDLLKRIEDLGADEVMLVSTTADPDEVERAAEAIA